jgi:hypothetical protein
MIVRLRFAPAPLATAPSDDEVVVVLDTTWTPGPDERHPRVVGLRDLAQSVLARRYLNAEASALLDRWVEESGVVEAMTVEGVSFWYGARLGHWLWLIDQLLWLGVLDDLLATNPTVRELACDAGTDPDLVAAVRLVAARDGLGVTGAGSPAQEPAGAPASHAVDGPAAAATTPPSASAAAKPGATPRRPTSFLGRLHWRLRPPEAERRRRLALRRVNAIAADPVGRLLVVQAHVLQRIDTAAGPRLLNPYLGPVLDRLRGGRLDPFEVDLRTTMASDEAAWARIEGPDRERSLPIDVIAALGVRSTGALKPRDDARARADTILASAAPLVTSRVDLGPDLARATADRLASTLPRRLVDTQRIRELLRRLHPAGILLADEYHRQDWLAAAGAEDVPVAAVQHGVIAPLHTGYIHGSRPPQLRLPGRTYVFGTWERDLLTRNSTYRPDEVVVGGSPRLDLVDHGGELVTWPGDDLRRELGVAPGERLLVISGTWGRQERRFQYPIALAGLFAAPLERVHVVIKLHPSEKDEGPYRSVIEGTAAAGGFAPPPVTVVQTIDLYRLLAAADAHLGIHSTLLTEAVATGTPNLLAAGLSGADLLGYLEAGVAVPVRTAADIAAVLDRPRDEVMLPGDREAFLRVHFEPGDASRRIADGLLAWMGAASRAETTPGEGSAA